MKNAIFGLKKTQDFSTEIILFFPCFRLPEPEDIPEEQVVAGGPRKMSAVLTGKYMQNIYVLCSYILLYMYLLLSLFEKKIILASSSL